MRSTVSRRARWATFALALAIALPAPLYADTPTPKKKKSVAECTSFDQSDRDEEDGVDFSVHNACSIPVSCSVSWALTCSPQSKKRRSRRVDSHAFQLDAEHGLSVTASSSRCGESDWSIDHITWSCQPSKN